MDDARGRSAVVVDPHPLWVDAVEQILKRTGVSVVGKAKSRSAALALVDEHRPDLLVAEIELRDGEIDGIALVREARERVPGLRVVVLSLSEDPQRVARALSAGALAYVVKTAHPDDVAFAVRQAFGSSIYLRRHRPAAETNARLAVRDEPPGPVRDVPLTRRELEVLRLVADGRSNTEIAKTLWVTEQTVKFHLSNIYRKLEVSNRTGASRWAQLHGLLDPVVPDPAEH